MEIINFKNFVEKFKLKNDTINEYEIQRVYNYNLKPRDSNLCSDKIIVFIDNGSQGGTHWTCFIVEKNKFYYYDSSGGSPDQFLLNQLRKSIIYPN